jgi:hypothetical protein
MYPREAKLMISKLQNTRAILDDVMEDYPEQYLALNFIHDQLLIVEAQIDRIIGDHRQ